MYLLCVTGQILWRRVLEKGYGGHIRTLGGVADGDLISVSGGVPAIVRAWDLATGHILNEWPIAEPNTDRFVPNNELSIQYIPRIHTKALIRNLQFVLPFPKSFDDES